MSELYGRKPDKATYSLLIALAVRTRADCIGRHVGAVITREGRVISTGYNGTPIGVANCSEGGCYRCSLRKTGEAARSGGYDICICVHAEQNAILTAARFGGQTLGGVLTSTVQPCFTCLKEMLQAGISEVRFLHPWNVQEAYSDPALGEQYLRLSDKFAVFASIGAVDADEPTQLFGEFLNPSE